MNDTYEYELYHHGIKGMKWGVRRFQKKDGSLTPAGKKRYDYEPEKFKASNGMVVAKPKNAYVRTMRKVASSRAATNAIVRSYESSMKRRHADTITNRLEIEKGKQRIIKENQAVREYNAHAKDLKRGTGTKYLDREIRENKIDNAFEKVQSSSSKLNRLLVNDATRRKAAQYMVDNNMSMKDATKKANKVAVRNTAIILAAYGALTYAQIKAAGR